jgi:glutathione S-transferase
MELVLLVVVLALLQFTYFSIQVGRARGKYSVNAPAMTGHPIFERYLRVQQNTLEQLILFISAEFMYSWVADKQGWAGYQIGAALGVVWLIGRGLYARSYVKDPQSRGIGFMLTFMPSAIMLVGTLVGIFASML